jgi:hypothetical protein
VASFPQASPPIPCAHIYPPPYAPHALPISFVSILPPAQYWVRSSDHSALRYLPGLKVAKLFNVFLCFLNINCILISFLLVVWRLIICSQLLKSRETCFSVQPYDFFKRDLQSTSLGVLSKCVARGGTCKGNLHQGFTLWIICSALYEACVPGQ